MWVVVVGGVCITVPCHGHGEGQSRDEDHDGGGGQCHGHGEGRTIMMMVVMTMDHGLIVKATAMLINCVLYITTIR